MTSQLLAFRLIHVFEGLRLKAYWDSHGNVWTIGFGHTKDVKSGDIITLQQAVDFFFEDIEPLYQLVKDKPVLEAAALISFGYNCGITAMKKVMANPENLVKYNKSGATVLQGLVSRRELENALIEVSKGV